MSTPRHSAEFNPYVQWLKLPEDTVAPNHYELLGIAVFECNPTVVKQAYLRSIAKISVFQRGRTRLICERLLEELMIARDCLIDEGMRAEYDAALENELRTQLELDCPRDLPSARTDCKTKRKVLNRKAVSGNQANSLTASPVGHLQKSKAKKPSAPFGMSPVSRDCPLSIDDLTDAKLADRPAVPKLTFAKTLACTLAVVALVVGAAIFALRTKEDTASQVNQPESGDRQIPLVETEDSFRF